MDHTLAHTAGATNATSDESREITAVVTMTMMTITTRMVRMRIGTTMTMIGGEWRWDEQ